MADDIRLPMPKLTTTVGFADDRVVVEVAKDLEEVITIRQCCGGWNDVQRTGQGEAKCQQVATKTSLIPFGSWEFGGAVGGSGMVKGYYGKALLTTVVLSLPKDCPDVIPGVLHGVISVMIPIHLREETHTEIYRRKREDQVIVANIDGLSFSSQIQKYGHQESTNGSFTTSRSS
ncbi:hypothetical protein J6590_098151 [Homalodisca vitripennis]|nr:hypothetical protein J6590_058469 [Homalodisca vitripennis]KAG8314195.1 hypothetical protein J6590_098151 [Homalodisca vitripennis]